MIREDKFLQSHAPYAVDLATLTVAGPSIPGKPHVWAQVDAVWFRRRPARSRALRGENVTVACAGKLRDLQDSEPASALAFLAAHADGRYGGRCLARWDGFNLWAPEMGEDERAAYFNLLVPMLDDFPGIPPGLDGWWTFRA